MGPKRNVSNPREAITSIGMQPSKYTQRSKSFAGTVSAASTIYGVTMEERGVAKTVSMRFNAERGDIEANPQNIAESVRGAKLDTTRSPGR